MYFFFLFSLFVFVFCSRRSFMSKLFNSKNNTVPVKIPNPKSIAPIDTSGIDLGIESSKGFDSMSTKSAGSREIKADDSSDLCRLIDVDDEDNEMKTNKMLEESADYDFLNNW